MVHKEGCVNRFHEVLEHKTDILNTTSWLTYSCETDDGGGGAEDCARSINGNYTSLPS
jgi:hypothetical protein